MPDDLGQSFQNFVRAGRELTRAASTRVTQRQLGGWGVRLADWIRARPAAIAVLRDDASAAFDASNAAESGAWYGGFLGRLAVPCIAVLLVYGGGGFDVFASTSPMMVEARGFWIFVALSIVVAATVPLTVTWAVICIVTGQPKFRETLRAVADATSMGLVVGFCFSCVGFAAPILFPKSFGSADTIPAFNLDTFIGGSTVGTVAGFLMGLFGAITAAASRFRWTPIGLMIGLFTEWIVARVIGSRLNPVTVLEVFKKGITAGLPPLPKPLTVHELNTLFAHDWRVIFQVPHGIEESAPSTDSFTFYLWLALFAYVACATAGRVSAGVRATRKERRRAAVEDSAAEAL
jgi:hypothetical protein